MSAARALGGSELRSCPLATDWPEGLVRRAREEGVMCESSEFGKGLFYPLALFLAHAGELATRVHTAEDITTRHPGYGGADEGAKLWLYAAADHLFELEPEHAPENLRERFQAFKDRCLARRQGGMTRDAAYELIAEAKALCLALDRESGVPAVEADYP